jgi:hypothetical protein
MGVNRSANDAAAGRCNKLCQSGARSRRDGIKRSNVLYIHFLLYKETNLDVSELHLIEQMFHIVTKQGLIVGASVGTLF